jgi:transcriptional regulator with XRE-family HTH domain
MVLNLPLRQILRMAKDKISLGQRIHERRDEAGLSLRKLADQIGIPSPFVSNIELGRRFPSKEILAKLANL